MRARKEPVESRAGAKDIPGDEALGLKALQSTSEQNGLDAGERTLSKMGSDHGV